MAVDLERYDLRKQRNVALARVAELEAALREIVELTSGEGLPVRWPADDTAQFKIAARLDRETRDCHRIARNALSSKGNGAD